MSTMTFVGQATGGEPAGGAALGEAIGATAAAGVATALIAVLIAGHRSGRIDWLDRAGRATQRLTGLPPWAALPLTLLNGALLTAVLGMYWDISLHIDNGRDPGPLANPAHYLILLGLYGVLLSGVLSAALAGERPSRTAVSLGAGWWAPVGGAVIAVCGAFALTGFPLDDLWHRLFGQDVTLWGPTHLMLIGGASMATLGAMALQSEAIGELGRDPERHHPRPLVLLRRGLLAGSFLVALSTFQGEFDFSVPQFREVLHPVLIMLAAGIGLVTARVYLGRGGALLAVLGFVLIRGLISLMVGGVWGQTMPHFPLYIVEALLVEVAFARAAGRSPVATGALAGVLIGTIGLAAEWGWSHVWMPLPWPDSLLPEAAIAGFLTAVAAGTVGGFVGGALARPMQPDRPRRGARRPPSRAGRPARPRGGDRVGPADLVGRSRQRGGHAHRPALDRRAQRAGHDSDPPRGWHRGCPLRERDRLAGRGQRGQRPEADRARPLPHHRADPRPRRLEGHGARAHRQLAGRRSDLPAARPRHTRS